MEADYANELAVAKKTHLDKVVKAKKQWEKEQKVGWLCDYTYCMHSANVSLRASCITPHLYAVCNTSFASEALRL